MKPIPLQLITVKLENGQQGMFVGTPLIADGQAMQNSQVSEIWFSDVRDLPNQLPLDELMALVHAQMYSCKKNMH